MAKTIEELLEEANRVKEETKAGQNTANRIGNLFEDIIGYLRDSGGGGASLNEPVYTLNTMGHEPDKANQILVFDGNSWVYQDKPSGGSGTSLNEPLNTINGLNRNPSETNQILVWNGTSWEFQGKPSGGGGTEYLNDLTDVEISSPSNNQILKYNGTKWVNDSGSKVETVNESDISDFNEFIVQKCKNITAGNNFHRIIKVVRSENVFLIINLYELLDGTEYKEYKVCGHITADDNELSLPSTMSTEYYKEYAIKFNRQGIITECVPLVYSYAFDNLTANLNIS